MTRPNSPFATALAPPTPEPIPEGEFSAATAGLMHGRMLQVSRLAAIGEMATGVAHELNQPLTAIANYAQACDRLLSRPGPDLEDVRTALREIAAQAVRAGETLRRLRGLAQSQAARHERTDLNATVEAIRDIILADVRVHRAQMRLDLAAGLPAVAIDAAQIQHVILNLVRNGVEAPAVPGVAVRELLVRTGLATDGAVEIAVLDNGPGLAARVVERMFDPFFSTKPEGTGLGLAISNSVVRAHGGVLAYRPNIPRGACFSIRLPAAAPVTDLPAAPAAVTRILLVDDHAGVRNAMSMLLRGEGFDIRCAASLAEAKGALRAKPPIDLVIADYHLQNGDTGMDVIAAARQVIGERLGAVLVSGDASLGLREVSAGERLRVAGKPLQLGELLTLIAELLAPGVAG